MNDENTDNLVRLFTLRYVLDDTSDIVNLEQDVRDLHAFPERLNGSYIDEWTVYLKKKLRRSKVFSETHLEDAVNNLSSDKRDKLDELLTIIKQAQTICGFDNVKVIKSPLKAYIEQLLKV